MSENERQLFQQIIATFDSPAYMRRSRDTEAAWNEVVTLCRRQYQSAAEIPLLRLAQVWHSCGRDLIRLPIEMPNVDRSTVVGEFQALIARWSNSLQPMLQRFSQADSHDDLSVAFQTLIASCDRFNRNWQTFVSAIDLSEVNRLRRDYNEYFLLEKECAVHSPLVARIGYEPLVMATHQDLFGEFPLLMPSLATPSVT